ncbi:hypothetical protein QJQ45_009546 [Haematococcus lacustris]|nr:hypothetical protein QJQ45_009546 [Haematococcus lacustris]
MSVHVQDVLHLGPAEAGLAQAIGLIPWNCTPLLGLLTDNVAILGSHRKAYLLLVGLLGCLSWALVPNSLQPWLVTALVFAGNTCIAWSQVLADAVMVQLSQGQNMEVAALYQGLSWVTYTCGALLSSCASGALLEHMGPRPVLIAASGFLLLDAGCAALISEAARKPTQPPHQQAGSRAWRWCTTLAGGRPLAQPQQGSAGSGVHEGSSARASLTADQVDERQPLLGQGPLPPQPMEDPGCTTTVAVLFPPPSYPMVLVPATMQHTGGQPACCPSPQLAVAGLLDGQKFGRRVEAMGLRGKLCQSTPNPSTALFYWQTSVLGFSPGFMQLVYLCGTLSGFAGLLLYNLALVRVNIRTLLLCCAVLGSALNALLLLQVSRVSVRLGIDDKLFALCDYSILYAIAERIGESLQCPPRLCQWDDLEALTAIGKEYQQRD